MLITNLVDKPASRNNLTWILNFTLSECSEKEKMKLASELDIQGPLSELRSEGFKIWYFISFMKCFLHNSPWDPASVFFGRV